MQRRAAYASFERTVLDLYDRKLLTLDQLDLIAGHYNLIDSDTGGNQFLLAHDGLDLYQICITLVDPSFPIAIKGSNEDHDEYWERELKKWEEIVHKRWGWHTSYTTVALDLQVKCAGR